MKEDDEVRKNSQPQRVVPRDDDNSKYFNVEGKKRIFCISVGQFEGGLNPLPNHHTDRVGQFFFSLQVLIVGTLRRFLFYNSK